MAELFSRVKTSSRPPRGRRWGCDDPQVEAVTIRMSEARQSPTNMSSGEAWGKLGGRQGGVLMRPTQTIHVWKRYCTYIYPILGP